nr:hypothetical protein [uncultured Duganella sp.]
MDISFQSGLMGIATTWCDAWIECIRRAMQACPRAALNGFASIQSGAPAAKNQLDFSR